MTAPPVCLRGAVTQGPEFRALRTVLRRKGFGDLTGIQCRADRVTLLGGRGENAGQSNRSGGGTPAADWGNPPADDLDDEIPFATCQSLY